MNINVNTNTGLYDINSGLSNTQSVSESELTRQKIATVPSDAVHYVKAGDTLSGQILGMNEDGTVSLLLGDNTKLNAFLSKGLGLTPGQTLSFTVSGASDSKISLTPLYANLDGNSAVGKALHEAGLPFTKQNSDMVTSMMERGLPIDSRSLQNMAADTARFPFADPKSIVQMKELEIPLNDSNIKEFEAYKENQYKIADSLDSLSQDLSNIAKEGLKTNDQVFNLFFEGKGEGLSSALDKALNGDFEDVAKLLKLNPEELKNLEAELKQAAEAEGAENPKGADNAKEALLPKEEGQSQIKQSTDLTGHVTDDLHTLLGKEGSNKLADMMREAGLNPSIASKVADGSLSTEDSLLLSKALLDKAMKEEMSGEASPELMSKARELLGSREYKLLLNNGITNEFLMKPEEVADKEKVREYYEKVVKNADKTLEFLNNSGRGATTLAQGMNNLRSNVDFMNQLNNVMTYMQLPLKMNEDKAHGDLYVYTNKKNLAKKDGNVSALLHLDMQHLGTMDIHVQMTNGENVKTHFILQKEEMLDFIGEHLPELDEALAKRGYKMNSDVSLNKEARDVPDIMFNRGANEKLIQTTSFDIRA